MKLVSFAVAHKFQLKVSTCNGGFTGVKCEKTRQAIVLVYKCINKETPRYVEDFFMIKICNYTSNLRGSGTLLTLPDFSIEWRHKSFSFLAAKLWNSLPTYVRNAKDISIFKCLLKKQVFR